MAMNRQYPPPYDYDSVAPLTILSVAARLSLTIAVTETSDAAKTHSSNKCAYSSHSIIFIENKTNTTERRYPGNNYIRHLTTLLVVEEYAVEEYAIC